MLTKYPAYRQYLISLNKKLDQGETEAFGADQEAVEKSAEFVLFPPLQILIDRISLQSGARLGAAREAIDAKIPIPVLKNGLFIWCSLLSLLFILVALFMLSFIYFFRIRLLCYAL